MSSDGLLIPIQSNARSIGNVKVSIFHFIGLLQDWVCPILPLKPVCRFGYPQNMSRHFWIQMGRDRNTGRARNCCGSLITSDASDSMKSGIT
jgi:hypothetical protein